MSTTIQRHIEAGREEWGVFDIFAAKELFICKTGELIEAIHTQNICRTRFILILLLLPRVGGETAKC
jgi:hypothetical protein